MNKQKALKTAEKLIAPVFYVLLIGFFLIYIQRLNWSVIQNADISWHYVIIATLLGLSFRYWGALIWMTILRSIGAKNLFKNVSQLVYVYAKSWLGRYIPGTAPWILGKIYFASKHGVSKNKLAVSSLLEGVLQIVVTMIVAILILVVDPRVNSILSNQIKLLLLASLLLGIVSVLPPVYNRITKLLYRLIKRAELPAEHKINSYTLLQGSTMYAIGSIVTGLSYFFIAKSIYEPLPYESLLFVIGASNLSSAISMLAVFAPSGIGIREGIQAALFTLIMPVEFAILIVIVTRLWSVAVDALFFIFAYLLTKLPNKV